MRQLSEEFEKIDSVARNIWGWLTLSERKFLFRSGAQTSGKGAIVEIGSWEGKSTAYLAAGSRLGGNRPVHAIDPHQDSYAHIPKLGRGISTLETFKENMARAGVADMVRPIVKLSKDAAVGWQEPIEILWIDGEHSYKEAKQDFDLFYSHVIEGGLIAFHDATYDDVKKVVKEVLLRSGRFVQSGIAGSIVHARKVPGRLGLADRIRNRWIILLIDAHDVFRKITPPPFLLPIRNAAKKIVDRL